MRLSLLALLLVMVGSSYAQNLTAGFEAPPDGPGWEPVFHPHHAEYRPLSSGSSLLPDSIVNYGQGERPMWEFLTPQKSETPLGDIARAYREEHAILPKAIIKIEAQGK